MVAKYATNVLGSYPPPYKEGYKSFWGTPHTKTGEPVAHDQLARCKLANEFFGDRGHQVHALLMPQNRTKKDVS